MHIIIFATGNKHKVEEAQHILNKKNITVKQINCAYPEIQANELEEIAAYGAKWTAQHLNQPVIVDDSGIFIEALNGFPGPYSAYVQHTLGNQRILKLMEGEVNRQAIVKSVIGYCKPNEEPKTFTGIIKGVITHIPRGTHGFGFDPIFKINNKTLAEMTPEEKNTISHRAKSLHKFAEWI
jgi:XTP/dITP diphosphohydrolase